MPEAAPLLFDDEGLSPYAPASGEPSDDTYVVGAAESFYGHRPYALDPYGKRNWGGTLHSLCSYQGKLKPSIAYFLVKWFTEPGETVLDPMAGVGTIPLEARRQGRVAVANDLSPLAAVVSQAKLEPTTANAIDGVLILLDQELKAARADDLDDLIASEGADFGLNGSVTEYFHPETLREVLVARRFFATRIAAPDPADALVLTSLLHVLHGNRPYALSRRSHPVTPLKPSGNFEYRSLLAHVRKRLDKTAPLLDELPPGGRVHRGDFANVPERAGSVDCVITSPPFAQSLRFYSSNWLRLWMCGWGPDDFKQPASAFLEREQSRDYARAYQRFFAAMGVLLKPGGLLILHLGATARFDMADELRGVFDPWFYEVASGAEHLDRPESHGLTDKGATVSHVFMFLRAHGGGES